MKYVTIIFLILSFALNACEPDPKTTALFYASKKQTYQELLNHFTSQAYYREIIRHFNCYIQNSNISYIEAIIATLRSQSDQVHIRAT